MRKVLISVIAVLILLIPIYAGSETCILDIPIKGQKQSNWCWAACSQCPSQRDCCEAAHEGHADCCNRWNYMYGNVGSIQDILNHFGSIGSNGSERALTGNEIITELCDPHCRPFVIRWEWPGGGGHFMVGRGIKTNGDTMIYYMDPLPVSQGGYNIASHDYMVSSAGHHEWTHTLTLTKDGPCPRVPVPTLSEWGLIIFAILMTGTALIVMHRRRKA
jgi:hypothetical protein